MTFTAYFAINSDDKFEKLDSWENYKSHPDAIMFILSIYDDSDVWYKRRFEFRDKDGNPMFFTYKDYTVIEIHKVSRLSMYASDSRIKNPVNDKPFYNAQIRLTIKCNISDREFDTTLSLHPDFCGHDLGVPDFYLGLKDFLKGLDYYIRYNYHDNFGRLYEDIYEHKRNSRILVEKVEKFKKEIDTQKHEHRELQSNYEKLRNEHEMLQNECKKLTNQIDGIPRKFNKLKKMITE